MIFHENRLLADHSHDISYLIFSKIRKDVEKSVVCCSRDWRFKGLHAQPCPYRPLPPNLIYATIVV